jgi:hypothetical protein
MSLVLHRNNLDLMETGTQGRRFTPHGIEDIMRRETRIVVGSDSQRDSYKDTDRDSVARQRQIVIR